MITEGNTRSNEKRKDLAITVYYARWRKTPERPLVAELQRIRRKAGKIENQANVAVEIVSQGRAAAIHRLNSITGAVRQSSPIGIPQEELQLGSQSLCSSHPATYRQGWRRRARYSELVLPRRRNSRRHRYLGDPGFGVSSQKARALKAIAIRAACSDYIVAS